MPLTILYHQRTKDLDGQRVHIREIQDAFRALGHKVVEIAPLAASERAGATPVRTAKRRVLEALSRLAPKGVGEFLQWLYNVPAWFALAGAIRRVRPDFIYERYSLNTVAGVFAARAFGIPLVLEVNSPLAQEQHRLGKIAFYRLASRIERYLLRHSSLVIAVSGVLRRMLLDSSKVPPDRIQVVPNGVSLATFDDLARRRVEIRRERGLGLDVVVGAVAFFHPWHGLESLLNRVASEPRLRSQLKVLLVGDGPALAGLEELARSLSLRDRVFFTGAVPHDDVPAYIAAMDFVVIPSAVEYASPLKLFEYMAAGKAIIAPRQDNLMEILTDGENALCFERQSDDQLTNALLALTEDQPMRARLGAAARATIEQRGLTWEGAAIAILTAVEQLSQSEKPHTHS